MSMLVSESQRRIDALSSALSAMETTTNEASQCCDQLSRRSRHLDSLTSPASDASAMLTMASHNLLNTLTLMKDSREKFDTVADCQPSIKRLYNGARHAIDTMKRKKEDQYHPSNRLNNDDATVATNANHLISEQEVYSAGDSIEIVRDAYSYFLERKRWKSTNETLEELRTLHQLGVDAMCLLVQHHFTVAGPAVKIKRSKGNRRVVSAGRHESAVETRKRISSALQSRELMSAVGEYEEYLPLETRHVRELRAIFECLGGDISQNDSYPMLTSSTDKSSLKTFRISSSKVVRTEKIGSGYFTNLVKKPLKTGFPHLDSYGEARKTIAYASIHGFHRHLREEQKKRASKKLESSGGTHGESHEIESSDFDAAARDAIRCLEHAIVVVAGEKTIYKLVVSPTSSHTHDETKVTSEYKDALLASYSHVVSTVVDKVIDIFETVFVREGSMKQSQSSDGEKSSTQQVRIAGSGAAAGLRILDGVRMLGPTLAKLCDMADSRSQQVPSGTKMETLAGSLCVGIHRLTVKNTAKTLETLAKAIQKDSSDGDAHRPPDATVAAVSSDVLWAIRIISPFASAYKSVTKRRALPWDQNIGDDASDMDAYVRFLTNRLLSNLQTKSTNYQRDPGPASMAKSFLFMINNTYYLLEQHSLIAKSSKETSLDREEFYRFQAPWFKDKVTAMFDSAKAKYLGQWDVLNSHLTSVAKNDLNYQSDKLLSLESGRLLKSRFSGFNEDFEKIYQLHRNLTVVDEKLRKLLQREVQNIFFFRYNKFFEKYSQLQFSKKKMDEYLKYPPSRIEVLLGDLYNAQL